MSRDLLYQETYESHGGCIPVKWTAPEVRQSLLSVALGSIYNSHSYRHCSTRRTPQLLMCGAMVFCSMKYGVSDTNLTKTQKIQRLVK